MLRLQRLYFTSDTDPTSISAAQVVQKRDAQPAAIHAAGLGERLWADFPILDQEVNGKPLAYLDNAATSQKPKQARQCPRIVVFGRCIWYGCSIDWDCSLASHVPEVLLQRPPTRRPGRACLPGTAAAARMGALRACGGAVLQ